MAHGIHEYTVGAFDPPTQNTVDRAAQRSVSGSAQIRPVRCAALDRALWCVSLTTVARLDWTITRRTSTLAIMAMGEVSKEGIVYVSSPNRMLVRSELQVYFCCDLF